MHSLLSGAPYGVGALVLSVVCLQGLPVGPLGLFLVVQYDLTSCSLRATVFPSPVELVSSLANPTVRVAVLTIPLPTASVWSLVC